MVLCLSVGLSSAALAQEQTGSLHGTIYDDEGNVLPGVTVTLASRSMMGTKTYVTAETGAFRFPALPPGIYTITAAMPGFKTLTRGEIIIRVGKVVTLNVTMEVTTIEEEITVIAASPVVDVRQTKIAITFDKNLITNIPMARDLDDIVMSSPGAVPFVHSSGQTMPMTHGGSVRGNTYQIEGVNINNPAVMRKMTVFNFDNIDEVEMIVGGQPASVGFTDGVYINVVTRSGGNRLTGSALVYYTNDSLSQQLWTEEHAQAFGVAKPAVDKGLIETSFTLGGPIIRDKLWFFTSYRYYFRDRTSPFIPFTDTFGVYHGPYDVWEREHMPFIKLTAQLSPKFKAMGMFQLTDNMMPATLTGAYMIKESRVYRDHGRSYVGNIGLNYILDQNTFFDLKLGYARAWDPYYMHPDCRSLPRIRDFGVPYRDITTRRYDESYIRFKQQAGLYFTRFQDNMLGGNHEFKAGVEWEHGLANWSTWREDNMHWFIDSREPGNYYYGLVTWKGVPNVGKGRVQFWHMGSEYAASVEDGTVENNNKRYSAYIQDSVTFGKRLTLNLGLRWDRMTGWHPPKDKPVSGNPLSIYIGDKYVVPYTQERWPEYFPDGLNPYREMHYDGWDDIFVWSTIQPRIGFSYDVFGDGKTALKASYGRYAEYLMMQYISSGVNCFAPRQFRFDWYDTNFNEVPDEDDDWVVYSFDYREQTSEFAVMKVDPDTKAPRTNELTVGLSHELFKNFNFGVNFIYKWKSGIFSNALYDPDTKEWWYHPDQAAAERHWIPFTTIIPGTDDYPDQTVTFYVRSKDAPELFYAYSNVLELERKYRGIEFIFDKRMADGWQFSGSVSYSKAYGNVGGIWGESSGQQKYQPNYFVNRWGPHSADRPLAIKLMGTAQLPLGLILSSYFRYYSGSPWERNGSIRPPKSWCSENNGYRTYYSVNLEPQGIRRNKAKSILDIRLEKEFRIGDFGRIGAYIDVLNLLGWSNVSVGRNDVYRYNPSEENVSEPSNVTLQSAYKLISSITGVRQVKVSLRFSF